MTGAAPPPGLGALVEFYLPLLVLAGDYARALQPAVTGPGPKAGPNAWAQALTDADQGVQAFLEVATRGVDPGLAFYGEEQATSRNARYFPVTAARKVWVDPINGTYLYQNQRDTWDIILSVTEHDELAAVISYQPARGRFNLAVRGHGALTGDRHCRRLADCAPLVTRSGSNTCLTYRAPAELARLRGPFTALDIVADDVPGRGPDNLNELFTGGLDAFLSPHADLLDWGAMAWLVVAAGGVATDLAGQPLDVFGRWSAGTTPIIASTTPAVHDRLLRALGA
jgi:fructose-1,6-bisphosphatase/inositol monophosphatase family enzyme